MSGSKDSFLCPVLPKENTSKALNVHSLRYEQCGAGTVGTVVFQLIIVAGACTVSAPFFQQCSTILHSERFRNLVREVMMCIHAAVQDPA